MKALMFANGIIEDVGFINEYLDMYDKVFCVDGGLRYVESLGIVPDFIIGDFDSAAPELLKRYEKSGASFVKFPPEKDFTDMELALRLAIEHGADDIIIFGALGGRLDHELANVSLLCVALKGGVRAKIVSEKQRVWLTDGETEIVGMEGVTVSLIPLGGEVSGITTRGLVYPLQGETLSVGESRGVSNVMTGDKAYVCVKNGTLLVICNC